MTTLRAALWLFHDVVIPSWREHRLRTILTLVGVIIGVQAVVGISLINRATLASFERTAEAVAGSADLQIANGSAGVPEALIAEVGGVPGVESAAGLIQGTVRTDWGSLTIFGVDLLADQRVRQTQFPREHVHIADELEFVNATDSVALSSSFARRVGCAPGCEIDVVAPSGRATLTARGVLDPFGPAALFDGAVALTDLPTAQRLFGLSDRVHQIDVKLAATASRDAVRAKISALAHGAADVARPRQHAARLSAMLYAVQTVLTLVGLSAIVVGAFIIYHTMHTAILQRRRDFALARAVGYSRSDIIVLLVMEVCTFGMVGGVVGTIVAQQAARAAIDAVTSGIGSVWAHIDRPQLQLMPWDYSRACLIGVTMCVGAAVLPMREIMRVQVSDQLRGVTRERLQASRIMAPMLGLLLILGGMATSWIELRPETFEVRITYIMASVVLALFGYTILIPYVAYPLMEISTRLSRRLSGIGLALATEHLRSDVRRSRDAVATLMLAFALVLIVGAFVASLRGSIMGWLDQTLTADLVVTSGSGTHLDLPSSPTMPGAMANTLEKIPGVAEVSPARMINVRVGESMSVLRSEPIGVTRRRAYPVVESIAHDWRERFAIGEDVLISENLSYRDGLHAGDSLTLATPSGRRAFEVAAVIVDYTLDIGTVVVERSAYERIWHDQLVNSFFVWLDGRDPAAVAADISARIAPALPVTVMTTGQFKATVSDALNNALRMTYAVQILAIGIAVIGVFNFFLADVEDRRREIGLLRGVALDAGQVTRVLAIEAFIIGAFGGVMAILYAWPVSFMLVTRSTRLISGWRLTFVFPYPLALVTLAVAGATSVIAAYYPVRRVTRMPIGELVVVE